MDTNATPQEQSDKFAKFLTGTVLVGEQYGKNKAAEWLAENESEIGKWAQDDDDIAIVNSFFDNPAHDKSYRKAFYVRVASLM